MNFDFLIRNVDTGGASPRNNALLVDTTHNAITRPAPDWLQRFVDVHIKQ